MNRSEMRETAMICVYQHLLTARDLDTIIEDMFLKPVKEVDPYAVGIIRTACENEERYAGYIGQILKEDWSYDRLGYLERAILLDGCAEFDLKQVEAPVIIDESVRMAKKYCDADAYKLINGVLDTL